MPWRNYVAGLTDATLGTLSGRNVGRVRKREREAAIAKTSRQAGRLAGQDIGGRLTACMMQQLLCCAVKRVGGPRTFQTPRPRAECGDLQQGTRHSS